MIEEHSQSCALAYETGFNVVSINDRIQTLASAIARSLLNCPWPGDEYKAVTRDLPLIRVVALLDQIQAIDPASANASAALMLMATTLDSVQLTCDATTLDLIARGGALAREKLDQCGRMSLATAQQRRTSFGTPLANPGGHVTTLADFVFLKRISSGAYARVFLARKEKTGDIYAIKVTPRSSISQKNALKRLLSERDILLQFTSPFIVTFCTFSFSPTDFSITGTRNLYLAMEFLPGGDLYSLLEHLGTLSETNARIYAAQIVSALHYLHSHDILHRDLKPDNILIAANGQLKLTDFGLSFLGVVDRGIKDDSVATADSIVGTPDYLAPEIVLSQPHSFTADYWSLGIILYEFLVGVPPFHGDTEGATFANAVRGAFDFADAELSAEARDLIRRLLLVDPRARLGANGIAEIQAHPWFADIDWAAVEELAPPFVPDVRDATSTAYFLERYRFEVRAEDDILDDIRDAKQRAPAKRGRRRLSDEGAPEAKLIKEFESVGVKQLSQFNQTVAQNMRHRRSVSMSEGKFLLPGSMSTFV
jgi:serine/threonine protein kinase